MTEQNVNAVMPAQVDRARQRMGILVHPAELGEAANGDGVSRNILEPVRGAQNSTSTASG